MSWTNDVTFDWLGRRMFVSTHTLSADTAIPLTRLDELPQSEGERRRMAVLIDTISNLISGMHDGSYWEREGKDGGMCTCTERAMFVRWTMRWLLNAPDVA